MMPRIKDLLLHAALIAFALGGSLAIGAQPGVYEGRTSQNRAIRVTVSADGLTVSSIVWSYGCFIFDSNGTYTANSPISNHRFFFSQGPGIGTCAESNKVIDGTFTSPWTVSGSFKVHEGNAPYLQCCQDTLSWSACLPTPQAVPDLTIEPAAYGYFLTWSSVAGKYDIIKGNLSSLFASKGDFSTAVTGCPAEDTSLAGYAYVDAGTPDNLFFLVRASDCAPGTPNGTYDVGPPSQVGSRDASITASSLDCAD